MRRIAEIIGTLAMATDLGLGLPIEHAIRACLMSIEMGRRLGLAPAELSELYYLTLLRMLGCTSGSADNAYFFGDEVAFGRETQHLDYGDAARFGAWVMTSFAADGPPREREQSIAQLFSYTPEKRESALRGHCEVAQMLAARLGFGGTVVEGLALVFERWDGSGARAPRSTLLWWPPFAPILMGSWACWGEPPCGTTCSPRSLSHIGWRMTRLFWKQPA